MPEPKLYKSRMKAALHEMMEGLFLAGLISERRMKACDETCLTKAGKVTVRARRERRQAKRPVVSPGRTRNVHHGATLESFLREERRRSARVKSKVRKA